MKVDPRTGKLCLSCNAQRPPAAATPLPHCPSPTCTWWMCTRCGAANDVHGHYLPGQREKDAK